ncbi:MAG TPA: XdhC family protein [Solirubrobacter sp.]|nr:XdhC family protein [Solirubrobacter sp.]
MEELLAERVPFVTATVVRAAKPTSVRPGDAAIVLADGTIDGFVGGVCAQASVRLHAARALETGEAVLLRLHPGAGSDEVHDGVIVAHNPCLSGGTLEIFLDPHLAAPRVLIVGETPIARALEDVARAAGYAVSRGGEIDPQPSDAALVVASHGDDAEADALRRGLEAGVGYIALVASPRRGSAVLAALEVDEALRGLVKTPAGLDIGARAPADIAISILAEMISRRTAHAPAAEVPAVETAVDPVCGMQVVVGDATPSLCVGGERLYFCCDGCRSAYAAEHGSALA